MNKTEKWLLDEIKGIVTDLDPKAKVYLFGSRSKGTSKKMSDWDLLILLNKKKITFEDENKITNPLYDLEFETGEVIIPMVYSENEWDTKYKITPFYQKVMRSAILL
ncbi:nucleotidyltransferase domain-containing protein [Aquiflexum sp.]|uniref:nucleotidyltransferase domain-containing protein n=1 Tax=Aquiflexum sp. TaxID=1872584 RepID=UPI0035948F41